MMMTTVVVMVVMYHFIAKKIVTLFAVCYFAYVPYRKSAFILNYDYCR